MTEKYDKDFDIFIEAVKKNNLDKFNLYYKKEYLNKPDENNINKSTPIHIEAEYGHDNIVKILIDNHCNIEAEDNWKRKRPIHIAAECGHNNIVKILIDNHCNIEAEDYYNKRPIHFAAEHGHDNIVKILIDNHCNIEAEDNWNRKRPIHYAAECGYDNIVKLLIDNHCNIEAEDYWNRKKPIHFAAQYAHDKIVKFLIDNHCNIEAEDNLNKRSIHIAAEYGVENIVKLLIGNHCNIEAEDKNKRRPIHLAAEFGHDNILKMLMGNHCNIEVEDNLNRRPIHLAAEFGHDNIVKILIDNHCNIEAEDKDNKTPLDCAREFNHTKCILFMENCTKMDNKTPLDCARHYNHTKCISLLEQCYEDIKMIKKEKIPACHEKFKNQQFIDNLFIGRGKFGNVYKYVDKYNNNETYAIQRVSFIEDEESNKYAEALKKEIEIYNKLPYHRRILQYYDTIRDTDFICVYMEYVEGGSIRSYLNKKGPMTYLQIHHYSKQILEGVAFLHEHNIIHRDIKGDNILIDSRNNVKLCDFGVSKNFGSLSKKEASTCCGTEYFMAPEVKKKGPYDKMADVWSFGVTVVEMLTDKLPNIEDFLIELKRKNMKNKSKFPNLNEFLSAFKRKKKKLRIPSTMTSELQSFIESTLRTDPQTRATLKDLLHSQFIQAAKESLL